MEAPTPTPEGSRPAPPAPLAYASPGGQPRPTWWDVVSNTLFGALSVVIGSLLLLGAVISLLLSITRHEWPRVFTFIFMFTTGLVLLASGGATLYVVVMRLRGYPPRAIENRVVHWFRVGGNSLRTMGVFGTWRR